MANREHLQILYRGADAWNETRQTEPNSMPDLAGADLSEESLLGADLSGADLTRANLYLADLTGAVLHRADLTKANLFRANLTGASLRGVNLTGADLRGVEFNQADLKKVDLHETILTGATFSQATLNGANLTRVNLTGTTFSRATLDDANLSQTVLTGADFYRADLNYANLNGAVLHGADLRGAHLRGAHLRGASLREADLREADFSDATISGGDLSESDLTRSLLIRTDLRGANITGCRVYGVSAWDVIFDEHSKQNNLIITPLLDPVVSVDELEVAQLIYMLLTGPKLRKVLDVVLTKAVLILGSFAERRKEVLDAIRDRLRELDYLPILFDYDGPENQNVVDTVKTVGMLARFVIVDLTGVKAADQELQSILAERKVPVQPLLLNGADPPKGMLEGLMQKYGDVVLDVYVYKDVQQLTMRLHKRIVQPAEARAQHLALQMKRNIMYVRDEDGDF